MAVSCNVLRRCARLLPTVAGVNCNRNLVTIINNSRIILVPQVQKRNLLSASCVSLVKPSVRFYAGGHPAPTRADIQERVLDVLKSFDKVDPNKVTLEAHFINDMGLDSLDTVEIVMAFEDEFALEIPDSDAEKIFNCQDAINYVAKAMDIEE